MAKTTADALIEAFANFVNEVSGGSPSTPAPVAKKGKAEPKVDEESGQVTLDREEVEGMAIVPLRALAKENGIDLKKKADILAAFEEKGFFEDSDEEDDEVEVEEDDDEADEDDDEDSEEEDDEDEDEDEEDGYSRDDLEEKTLRELKVIAKQEGHSQADIKGLDQEGLIDLILGDTEDEEEADDDDEEEDEEEGVEIDKETLDAMSDAELKNIAKEFGIKLPKKASHKTMVQTILDAAEEDDEDDD